jgi:signal transduction histidine kinase
MDLVLISSDCDLYTLCRQVMSEVSEVEWRLSKVTPGEPLPEADLYIWDNPSIDLANATGHHSAKHLFLVQRGNVAEFRHIALQAETAILLQPVTRACLAAFLGFAASTWQGHAPENFLRADRDEILQCLIASNLQIQEYDQDRTNFLARMVHDFRAPLTATSGYCGLLLSEALGPVSEQQKEVLRRMQHSLKRLSRMASGMFELSVDRHSKRHPLLRQGDLRGCVEQALHELAHLADGKRLAVSVDLLPAMGDLYFESGQIEQVLLNLLDNACKFTPAGGSVEIQGYPYFWERGVFGLRLRMDDRRDNEFRSPNTYRIDIRDSGPQIPREHLERIFEEYTSYAGVHDRSGGGLGLAICRMIVNSHDGRVWAENTEDGPRFSFVLPVRGTEPQQKERDHEELAVSE